MNDLLVRIQKTIATLRRGFGAYTSQIIALAFLGFAGGTLEGLGINALIPLFSLIVGKETGTRDAVTVFIERLFSFIGMPLSIGYLLLFIATLFIFKAVLQVAGSYIQLRIVADYEEATRNRLFRAMLAANWPFLVQEKLGHLQAILMTNVSTASSLLSHIGLVIMIIAALLVYVTVAVNISLTITAITLALAGSLFFLFRSSMPKIRALAYHTQAVNKQIAHHVDETVVGMKTVKAFSVADAVAERAREYFRTFKTNQLMVSFLGIVAGAILQPASLVLICVVFAISYRLPNFNFAALIAVAYLIKQIFVYVESLQKKFFSMHASFPALEDLLRYEDATSAACESFVGALPFRFERELRFHNVSFAYREHVPVLADFSFVVPRGQMVGLIGPSGAGKTTISDLVLRLLTPTSGVITVDDVPIHDIAIADWRRRVGYVSQDVFLLNDTIAANIRFYDASITDDAMVSAAKAANIYDFIMQRPQGFDAVVGERGLLLSGGQRQRLSIARVLARKPEVLILDEATSALDNESELRVHDVIMGLRGKITVLVIAHRLSTILSADAMVALDHGSIVESGAPLLLLKDPNTYLYKMYHIRDGGQEIKDQNAKINNRGNEY